MDLTAWSWLFLALFVGMMVVLGLVGRTHVRGADDFATARGSYGPVFLALATASTISSGATFLGSPGIAYEVGISSLWAAVLAPVGAFLGLSLSMRLITIAGHRFGNRSIPEFLGDRYQSDGLRIAVALFSLLLLLYLTGQIVAGLVMFEVMLGISPFWGLALTTTVLGVYVSLGGAHADILTDGVQGFLMLLIAILVIVLFAFGAGVGGGPGGVLKAVEELDANALRLLNPDTPLFHSWWSLVALVLAHVPLGLLPHIGNKLWALREARMRRRFVWLTMGIFLLLSSLGLGGLLARAVFGDALLAPGSTPNESLPTLFIHLFPPWLAALLGIGILSAVMSTADGLVVSSSQIIANDLYRRSVIPRWGRQLSSHEVDRRALEISRWSTVGFLLLCAALAWLLMEMNVTLLVWIGLGGMMAGFAGPLVLGSVWQGVTRAGAVAGLVAGVVTFSVLHSGILDPAWLDGTRGAGVLVWVQGEAPNPFSCAALGQIVSVVITVIVSLVSSPLPPEHLERLFGEETQ